jgi:hypothetical protein
MCSTSGLWGNWSLILVGLGWIPSFQENKKKKIFPFQLQKQWQNTSFKTSNKKAKPQFS